MLTLTTLNKATAQEIFDQVATHLLTQKEKSEVDGDCKYHLIKEDKVLKCAAGCLIGEDEYTPQMEGQAWGTAFCTRFNIPDNFYILIHRLQDIHDHVLIEDWRDELIRVANKYKLNTRVIA